MVKGNEIMLPKGQNPPPGTENTIAPGRGSVHLHEWSVSSLWLLKEVGSEMDGLMHKHYPQGESQCVQQQRC